MIEVICDLCKEKGIETKLASKILAKSEQKEVQLLGQEMVAHIANGHPETMQQIVMLIPAVNGLLITRHFSTEHEGFNMEREEMRDRLCEAIMLGAPDEGDDFEDKDEYLEDELEDDEDMEIEPLEDGTFGEREELAADEAKTSDIEGGN